MTMLTAAELAAAMRVSTRTVARWVAAGCPCEWAGAHRRYYLAAVQAWNREQQQCRSEKTPKEDGTPKHASVAAAFTDACRQVQLRAMPSASRPS